MASRYEVYKDDLKTKREVGSDISELKTLYSMYYENIKKYENIWSLRLETMLRTVNRSSRPTRIK